MFFFYLFFYICCTSQLMRLIASTGFIELFLHNRAVYHYMRFIDRIVCRIMITRFYFYLIFFCIPECSLADIFVSALVIRLKLRPFSKAAALFPYVSLNFRCMCSYCWPIRGFGPPSMCVYINLFHVRSSYTYTLCVCRA